MSAKQHCGSKRVNEDWVLLPCRWDVRARYTSRGSSWARRCRRSSSGSRRASKAAACSPRRAGRGSLERRGPPCLIHHPSFIDNAVGHATNGRQAKRQAGRKRSRFMEKRWRTLSVSCDGNLRLCNKSGSVGREKRNKTCRKTNDVRLKTFSESRSVKGNAAYEIGQALMF